MPNRLGSPHSKDHYTFLKEFLDPPPELEQGKEIPNTEAIIKQIAEAQSKLKEEAAAKAQSQTQEDIAIRNNIQANLEKLTRAKDDLFSTQEKKQLYDNALSIKKPSAHMKTEGKNISLIPLAKIKDITNEFHSFAKEQIGKEKLGGGLYAEGDFTYKEGPPGTHTYTFPDEKSAQAFIERLFNKNMAMLPGGSQNTKDIWPEKQKTAAMKPAADTQTPLTNMTPINNEKPEKNEDINEDKGLEIEPLLTKKF